jgi:hypothetical protein
MNRIQPGAASLVFGWSSPPESNNQKRIPPLAKRGCKNENVREGFFFLLFRPMSLDKITEIIVTVQNFALLHDDRIDCAGG